MTTTNFNFVDIVSNNEQGALCPDCGSVNTDLETPEYSFEKRVIGSCEFCDEVIYAKGTNQQANNRSQQVRKGTWNEEKIADHLLNVWEADYHEDRGTYSHIDRDFYSESGELLFCAEIKTRTCYLNGYKKTKFPHTKIVEGQRLSRTKDVPVYIVIEYEDCLASHEIDPDKKYDFGSEQFSSNSLDTSGRSDVQIPAEVRIDSFEVLPERPPTFNFV